MSGWLMVGSETVVRAWTWLYTLPLDPAVRTSRRLEVASDVWEFRHDRSRHDPAAPLAVHVLVRAILGVPHDLLWSCEQYPVHGRTPSRAAVVRCVFVIVAAWTLAASASSPALDPARILKVNVVSGGFDVTRGRGAPTLAFTLTNVGDRRTSALKVNALFHAGGGAPVKLGTAVSWVVGWRGLAPGEMSPVVRLGPREPADGKAERIVPLPAAPGFATPRVKLFVQHEGRWTLLGDYLLHAQAVHP